MRNLTTWKTRLDTNKKGYKETNTAYLPLFLLPCVLTERYEIDTERKCASIKSSATKVKP